MSKPKFDQVNHVYDFELDTWQFRVEHDSSALILTIELWHCFKPAFLSYQHICLTCADHSYQIPREVLCSGIFLQGC